MSTILTNLQKKELAKMLYLQSGLNFQEIAGKVGANRTTIGRWAEKEKWEMLRAAGTTTREEQIRNMYVQIAEINREISSREKRFATPAEADTIGKLSAAIAKLEGESNIADIISVSRRMLLWIRKEEPKRLPEMIDLFDRFVKLNLQ